jgi:hypothetical protein
LPSFNVQQVPAPPSFIKKVEDSLPLIGGIAAIGLGAKELKEGIQAKRRANRRQKDYQADLKERMDDIAMGEYVNTPYNAKFGGVMNYYQDGGKSNDKEMLEGVSDILRRVKDPKNRKELADYMMQNFKEENVDFTPNNFLNSSNVFAKGGEMIKRADGSYSRRGLWDNLRKNRGSGRKPTKEMLEQERKIRREEKQMGGMIDSNLMFDFSQPQYMEEMQILEGGGYKVERSNDRKGKTHKVTGPDGSVKYFGDPNMKERGQSKYGEEAFYARHKKNLEKNPHFRAYARATWQDGGMYEDNDSWLENISEIVDPTGVSSWDDVYRSYKNTGLSGETALEVFGALPLLGKVGKAGKMIEEASKAFAITQRQKRNAKTAANILNSTGKYGPTLGKTTDAVQAAIGSKNNSGFQWNIGTGTPSYNGRNVLPTLSNDNTYAKGGIYIKPENKGKFTAQAQARGMGVQEFANKVMANKEDYSPTTVKRANFAKNFGGRKKHEMGGMMEEMERMFQMGGSLEGVGQMYDQQRDYNRMRQEQFANYYNQMNQQNQFAAKSQINSGIGNIVSGIGSTAKAFAGFQDGGEYDPTMDVNSAEFNAEGFGGYKQGSDLEALMVQEAASMTDASDMLAEFVFPEPNPVSPEQLEYEANNAVGASSYITPSNSLPTIPNSTSSNQPTQTPSKGGLVDIEIDSSGVTYKGDPRFKGVIDEIKFRETRNKYGQVNELSNTVGAYQFMTSVWADQIKTFMGLPEETDPITTMKAFQNNPQVQEDFMTHVVEDIYAPQLPKLRPYAEQYGLDDDALIKLIHYRGIGDARKRLRTGNFEVDAKEKAKYNNPDILEYIKTKPKR